MKGKIILSLERMVGYRAGKVLGIKEKTIL